MAKRMFTTEEKIKIIELTKTKTRRELAKEYGCTIQSIAAWKQLFDGTTNSLKINNSKDEKAPQDVKDKVSALLKKNPYLNTRDIKMYLDSYKYARTIKDLVLELSSKEIPFKYKNSTQVNSMEVDMLNERDLIGKRIETPFYLIEINNSQIYLSRENDEETAKFTVFYSSAVRFKTKEEAKKFIDENQVKNSRYQMSIKKVDSFKF